ncbi:MAG: motility associated factor glycosyltransferase family protein, partial [Chlamydiales bacterium]|nr:motility associated factor glycosyltransferase family protein [Chlamydiales bacterium]
MDVIPSFSSALLDLKGDLSEVELICIYGIADGAAYRHLRSWLRKNPAHRVVFLEEDEAHFLKMKESGLASDPQVRLLFYTAESEELFKEIAWEFVFLKIGFYARERDLAEKGGKILELFAQVEHYHRAVELVASDFQDMGEKVLSNIAQNRKLWVSSRVGQLLAKRWEKIPAIICGASPSLDEDIPLLAQLRDRALLFAGGTAVAALTKQGVFPHFCLHLDPDPPRNRFLEQDAAEIPHFYQSRF